MSVKPPRRARSHWWRCLAGNAPWWRHSPACCSDPGRTTRRAASPVRRLGTPPNGGEWNGADLSACNTMTWGLTGLNNIGLVLLSFCFSKIQHMMHQTLLNKRESNLTKTINHVWSEKKNNWDYAVKIWDQSATRAPTEASLHLEFWKDRLVLHWLPRLHLRLKVHQAEGFLRPQVAGEPAGDFIATVPTLDVFSKHSAEQKSIKSSWT